MDMCLGGLMQGRRGSDMARSMWAFVVAPVLLARRFRATRQACVLAAAPTACECGASGVVPAEGDAPTPAAGGRRQGGVRFASSFEGGRGGQGA